MCNIIVLFVCVSLSFEYYTENRQNANSVSICPYLDAYYITLYALIAFVVIITFVTVLAFIVNRYAFAWRDDVTLPPGFRSGHYNIIHNNVCLRGLCRNRQLKLAADLNNMSWRVRPEEVLIEVSKPYSSRLALQKPTEVNSTALDTYIYIYVLRA